MQQFGDLFESPVYMACNFTDILRSRYKCDCLTVCNIIKRMHYYEINSECFISMCSGKMLALHVFNAKMLCVHKKPVNSSCVVFFKIKVCLMQCRPNMSIINSASTLYVVHQYLDSLLNVSTVYNNKLCRWLNFAN